MSVSRGDADGHEHRADKDGGLARPVRAPAPADEKSGKPAAQRRAQGGKNVRHPGGSADLAETEMPHVGKIFRQPEKIEPPDGIAEKAGQDDAPDFAVTKQDPPGQPGMM